MECDALLDDIYIIEEMAMTPGRLTDKFTEVVLAITDNIAAVCLYPDNPTVNHWRERVGGLCRRFITIDLTPRNKNNTDTMLKCIHKAYDIELNKDFSMVEKRFRTVSEYYADRINPKDNLIPYTDYKSAYKENKERVESALKKLAYLVASQDNVSLNKFIKDF